MPNPDLTLTPDPIPGTCFRRPAATNQSAAEASPGSGVQAYSGEPKEGQQTRDAKEAMEAREKEAASAFRAGSITGSIAEEDDTGGAVTVDEAGLDRVRYCSLVVCFVGTRQGTGLLWLRVL